MRQAFAGMLWSKQLYYYDVGPLAGRRPDPAAAARVAADRPQRPLAQLQRLRHHVDAGQVGVPVVRRLGPGVPLRRAGPRRPGIRQVPADSCCAGSGSSTPTARCPPTSGTSATSTRRCRRGRRWRCSPSTAAATSTSCRRVFDKLLVNFTWWVNLEDADGSNLFEGGFLGLDNIGPLDRSHLPVGRRARAVRRHRLDGVLRPGHGRHRADPATAPGSGPADRPGAQVPRALRRHPRGHRDPGPVGRDRRAVLRPAGHARRQRGAGQGPLDGRHHPAAGRGRGRRGDAGPGRGGGQAVRRVPGPRRACATASRLAQAGPAARASPGSRQLLLGVVGIDRLERLFDKLFDEAEFLSPYGLRAISAYHREHPYELEVEGMHADDRLRAGRVDHRHVRRQLQLARPDLVPAQLPAWSRALERYHRFFGDDFTVEYPTGSGQTAAARRDRRTTCASG